MAHKKGVVNLEGRLLQAASFYNPPLCYLNNTINRTINGIDAQVFLADNGNLHLQQKKDEFISTFISF